MPLPTNEDFKRVNKNQDDAIAELVDAVPCCEPEESRKAKYSRRVYEAAWKLVEACTELQAVYDKRLDIDEYVAEVERRRQIGLTIDPATAETTFWWADYNDPYCILDRKYHAHASDVEQFARHPGAGDDDWVDFGDLPKATREALQERDKHKLSFPYGLHVNPDGDLINYPPKVQVENGCVKGTSEPEGE